MLNDLVITCFRGLRMQGSIFLIMLMGMQSSPGEEVLRPLTTLIISLSVIGVRHMELLLEGPRNSLKSPSTLRVNRDRFLPMFVKYLLNSFVMTFG